MVSRDITTVLDGFTEAALVYGSGGGDWDYAPRGLLYQELGAVVSNIGKNISSPDYDYRNHDFLAASPEVFERLFPVIQTTLT
jgi:fructose-1,6-bisphosphatase/inositol monophosphatase family enzyme